MSWASEKVKLELICVENGPLSVHTHAMVMQLLKEQPDGPSGGGDRGFPRLIRSIARGGAGDKPPR